MLLVLTFSISVNHMISSVAVKSTAHSIVYVIIIWILEQYTCVLLAHHFGHHMLGDTVKPIWFKFECSMKSCGCKHSLCT